MIQKWHARSAVNAKGDDLLVDRGCNVETSEAPPLLLHLAKVRLAHAFEASLCLFVTAVDLAGTRLGTMSLAESLRLDDARAVRSTAVATLVFEVRGDRHDVGLYEHGSHMRDRPSKRTRTELFEDRPLGIEAWWRTMEVEDDRSNSSQMASGFEFIYGIGGSRSTKVRRVGGRPRAGDHGGTRLLRSFCCD